MIIIALNCSTRNVIYFLVKLDTSNAFCFVEVEDLRRHVNSHPVRTKEWKEHIEENKLKIIEEQRKNQDLLLLPFQDIYSNLPQKTKNFLMW